MNDESIVSREKFVTDAVSSFFSYWFFEFDVVFFFLKSRDSRKTSERNYDVALRFDNFHCAVIGVLICIARMRRCFIIRQVKRQVIFLCPINLYFFFLTENTEEF